MNKFNIYILLFGLNFYFISTKYSWHDFIHDSVHFFINIIFFLLYSEKKKKTVSQYFVLNILLHSEISYWIIGESSKTLNWWVQSSHCLVLSVPCVNPLLCPLPLHSTTCPPPTHPDSDRTGWDLISKLFTQHQTLITWSKPYFHRLMLQRKPVLNRLKLL